MSYADATEPTDPVPTPLREQAPILANRRLPIARGRLRLRAGGMLIGGMPYVLPAALPSRRGDRVEVEFDAYDPSSVRVRLPSDECVVARRQDDRPSRFRSLEPAGLDAMSV